MTTNIPQIYWSIDHERVWLASRVAERLTTEDKIAFIDSYLWSLDNRYVSFLGDGPMEHVERDDMENFALRLIFEVSNRSIQNL